MAVTIKDIAEYAKISTATVSLALQNKSCVAEKTRKLVQRLAADLGYMPSGIGRALQSGKSGLIGYIIPNVSSSYFNEVLQGVGLETSARGYGLLTAITGDSDQETMNQLGIFREKRIDGLLCSSCASFMIPKLMEFEKAGCPVAFCSMESPIPGIPFAVTDDFAGGKRAASHLVAQGAKRIAYFQADGVRGKRFEGASAKTRVEFIGSELELEKALKAKQRPDAIIAFCDEHAILALKIAKACSLRIPQDLMLVGFDNSRIAELPGIELCSMAPQKRRIGQESARILMARMAGEKPEPELLEASLVKRASALRR